jgi:hypothetical protein
MPHVAATRCAADNLSHEDLDEMNIEIMRNTLYKVCRPQLR